MNNKQSILNTVDLITSNEPCSFEVIKLFDNHEQFLGIGEPDEDNSIKPKRLFI